MTKRIITKSTLLLLLFPLALTSLLAQSKTVDDILSIRLENTGVIEAEDNTVAGYYMFYQTAKAKKGERKYTLDLLDPNLEQVGRKSFTGSRYFKLKEADYNGQNLAIRLVDDKEKEVEIKILDASGERINGRKTEYSAYDSPAVEAQLGALAGWSAKRLFGVSDQGFVYYSAIPRKGTWSQTDYEIMYIPNNRENRGWTKKSSSSSEDYELATFLAATETTLYSSLIRRKNRMSRDFEYHIIAHDLETGNKLFEKSLESRRFAVTINNAILEDGVIRFFGEYYGKEEKTAKASSLGICTFKVDEEGNITDEQYLGWNKEISDFLPANMRGKIEDVGYLYFHDFIKPGDGKIYAVAESYRTAASAWGIADRLAGGGQTSLVKVVVEDLYVFTFSDVFQLEAVDVFEKDKSSIELPAGAEWFGAQTMGLLAKLFNGFDYTFYQQEDDVFTIGYRDWERRNGERNGLIYGSISHVDGEFATDKIRLETDATSTEIYNAQPGYVFILEYFAKEKNLNLRLEKLNN